MASCKYQSFLKQSQRERFQWYIVRYYSYCQVDCLRLGNIIECEITYTGYVLDNVLTLKKKAITGLSMFPISVGTTETELFTQEVTNDICYFKDHIFQGFVFSFRFNYDAVEVFLKASQPDFGESSNVNVRVIDEILYELERNLVILSALEIHVDKL